jgi:hypothetical protein
MGKEGNKSVTQMAKSYLSYTHNQFSYLKYRQALEIALKAYTARRRKMK